MALLTAIALLLASCGEQQSGTGESGGSGQTSGEETVPSGEEAESAGQARAITVADLTDNPSEFYGQTVTVSGPIGRIVEPNVFVMVSEQAMDQSGGDVNIDTLTEQGVLVAGGGDLNVSEGQSVQVTGQIQQFDVNQFEEELGTQFDQNNDVYSAFSGSAVGGNSDTSDGGGRPAIIADSVQSTS